MLTKEYDLSSLHLGSCYIQAEQFEVTMKRKEGGKVQLLDLEIHTEDLAWSDAGLAGFAG